jgi:hypothetical protein
MGLDELINQAEELKNVTYDSPKINIWKKRAKDFIKQNYEEEYLEIFINCLTPNRMILINEAQKMYIARIDKAIEFLNDLKKEPILGKTKVNQKDFQKKQMPHIPTSKSSYGNITISGGTVVFGDGNKITQVAIRDLVNALSKEIEEKVPESEARKSVLNSLKEITNNQTFASVAGALIGEILRRISGF